MSTRFPSRPQKAPGSDGAPGTFRMTPETPSFVPGLKSTSPLLSVLFLRLALGAWPSTLSGPRRAPKDRTLEMFTPISLSMSSYFSDCQPRLGTGAVLIQMIGVGGSD